MDFSIAKFCLIAKAWCEENARKSGSPYHNFMCKECLKAFPCKAALKLHSNTHSEEKTSKCPLCESDFMDTTSLHIHMIKHMSDIAFSEAQKHSQKYNRKSITSDKAEEIGKHDFLASFGLNAKIEASSDIKDKSIRKRQAVSPHSMEKRENTDYFAKLGQIFSPTVSPIKANKSDDGFAEFAEFAKMLQSLSPSGLMNGVTPQMSAGLEQYASMLNPAQLAAFLPSFMPFGMGNSGMNMSELSAMMTQNQMLYNMANKNSGLPTPPPSNAPSNESNSSGGNVSSPGDKNNSNIVYPCKYCDMMFPNYRTLKGELFISLSPFHL